MTSRAPTNPMSAHRCRDCAGLLGDDSVFDTGDRLHGFCAYRRVREREERRLEEIRALDDRIAQLIAELEHYRGASEGAATGAREELLAMKVERAKRELARLWW